jgi:hypothetical protein
MAHCNQCGRDVGCGCNLINGACGACYNKAVTSGEVEALSTKRSTKRVIYKKPTTSDVPNTEFETILNTQTLTKEEKIRRINDILEKARQ